MPTPRPRIIQQLLELAEEFELSQAELARMLGVGSGPVSRMYTGGHQRSYRVSTLRGIAERFGQEFVLRLDIPGDTEQQIHKQLRRLRDESGLPSYLFASKIGVGRETWRSLELGGAALLSSHEAVAKNLGYPLICEMREPDE